MRIGAGAALLAAVLAIWGECSGAFAEPPASATPLTIDIVSPADRASQRWGSQLSYSAQASYRGKSSRFGELPASAVVMEARYLPDVAAAPRLPREVPAALVVISQSNCAACHDFSASGAGPSFAAVAQRYAGKREAIPTIAQHIREGVKGLWGASAMPPHPDLTAPEAETAATWIVEHGDDPGVGYAIGTQGSVRMAATGTPGPQAGVALTALYTGPLAPGETSRIAAGRSRIVLLGQ